MAISFHFEEAISLQNRSNLKAFLTKLSKKEQHSIISLSYVFCSDDYLLGINRNFLQHDYFTDIITFDLAGLDSDNGIHGEIYISVDRVRDNAREYNTTITHELHRVIFHGLLHLCGYKDKSKGEQLKMRSKEDHYLQLYFK